MLWARISATTGRLLRRNWPWTPNDSFAEVAVRRAPRASASRTMESPVRDFVLWKAAERR